MPPTKAVLKVLPATPTYPGAQFRLAGDRYTLTDPFTPCLTSPEHAYCCED